MDIFDSTVCTLGEGPLWHPERKELFWFDILSRRLHRQGQHWQFDEIVSAAGWVDDDSLLIASQTALLRFTISTGAYSVIAPLEADNAKTRSNDGRADPQGGFWIGTMGLEAEAGAGTIWRYYKGDLRAVVENVTISNAICFAPDGKTAYYADTSDKRIMKLALDADGWPKGEAEVHIDMTRTPHAPDGAVVARDGTLWSAQWGSARVARYGTDGTFIEAHEVPALQTSCPAFGGPDMRTLYVTSAAAGLSQETFVTAPLNGQTFMKEVGVTGQKEHRVIL